MRYKDRFIRETYAKVCIVEYQSNDDSEYNHITTEPYFFGSILNCFGNGDWTVLYSIPLSDNNVIGVGIIADDNNLEREAEYSQSILDKLTLLRESVEPILKLMDKDEDYVYIDRVYINTPQIYSVQENRKEILEQERKSRARNQNGIIGEVIGKLAKKVANNFVY